MKPLPYREVIKKARKAGFDFRRNTGGTHEIWWNEQKFKALTFLVLQRTSGLADPNAVTR